MFAFEPKVRYFAEVEAADGIVFCAFKDDEPTGIICLRNSTNAVDIAYLYVQDECRKQGIAKRLAEHALGYAKEQEKSLQLRISNGSDFSAALSKIAESLDMQYYGESIFLKLDINEETKRLWDDNSPEFREIAQRLSKRYRVISFAEAEPVTLKRLQNKIGNKLPGLNPFTLPDLNYEFSFIALHGEEPVAFNAVRTIGDKMIYEISAAGKGSTVMAGIPDFFDKLFASDIKHVVCTVYSNNKEGLKHASIRFGFLFKESNRQAIYITGRSEG